MEVGHLSLLQQIRVSTRGTQTVKRIDLAQKNVFVMSSPCFTYIVISSRYLPVQTWFVYFSLSVQPLSSNFGYPLLFQVQFPTPVIVEEVRVIPLGARVQANFPGGVRLGATNPAQFNLEFFVNDLSKSGASTFESLGVLSVT